ncbi:MAG: BON domain-containing protein [Parvularcula sp.]
MTATIRFLLASLLIVALSGCVTNRTLGTGLDDTGADATMKTLLLRDGKHNYRDVDITVFEGRMLLTGTVRDEATLSALEGHARRVANIKEVLNEVVVGKATGIRQGTSDAFIDRKLVDAMIVDNGIYRNNYQIAVSQGTVYILGVAQGPVELDRVIGQAQAIKGVKNIVSHVVYVRDPRRQRD